MFGKLLRKASFYDLKHLVVDITVVQLFGHPVCTSKMCFTKSKQLYNGFDLKMASKSAILGTLAVDFNCVQLLEHPVYIRKCAFMNQLKLHTYVILKMAMKSIILRTKTFRR